MTIVYIILYIGIRVLQRREFERRFHIIFGTENARDLSRILYVQARVIINVDRRRRFETREKDVDPVANRSKRKLYCGHAIGDKR